MDAAGRTADLVLVAVVVAHVFLAPHTKVEESFNMQAMHDLQYHRLDLASYDHHDFPGVVPRTFIGAAVVAALAAPAQAALHVAHAPALYRQHAVRITLGLLLCYALHRLRAAVASRFGASTGVLFALVTASQFHIPFYCSRALPNTFAMGLVALGLAHWLAGRPYAMINCMVFATVVLRSDTVVLLGPLMLVAWARREVPVIGSLAYGCAVGAGCLLLSVLVDSPLWGRLLWPEGEVLYFNTVLNKSSEWGTQPAHWYFTSAIPRAMTSWLLLVPLGCISKDACRWLASWRSGVRGPAPAGWLHWPACAFACPALAFVALYSALPHKELRFILGGGVLALNVLAARGARHLLQTALGWREPRPHQPARTASSAAAATADEPREARPDTLRRRRGRSPPPPTSQDSPSAPQRRLAVPPVIRALAGAALLAVALTAMFATTVFVRAARVNYPGAEALHAAHELIGARPASVHIDAASAMQGVTRFLQLPAIRYDKNETLARAEQYSTFDYLLTADPGAPKHAAFEVVHTAHAFERLQLVRGAPRVLTKPEIYVMRRRAES